MEIAGYICACLIGLTMGLTGSGGSILTVPLLVYVFGIDPVIATAYSLFIVGTTSAVGAIRHSLAKNIAYKTALIIAVPSFLSIYLTRRFIIPQLPENFSFGAFSLPRHTFIMGLFAFVMFMVALSMLAVKKSDGQQEAKKIHPLLLLLFIGVVGVIMGLVGAGGGFMIMPMLIIFGGLTVKRAIGTSLFIVTLNSLTGFSGDINTTTINWPFLLTFTILSVFGIFVGTYLHKYVNEKQLKKGFAVFILSMALFIIAKEMYSL